MNDADAAARSCQVGEQLAGYHEQIRRALEIPPQVTRRMH